MFLVCLNDIVTYFHVRGFPYSTAGLTTCCVDILAHTVGAVLVLEVLSIAALIVLCMVCLLDPPSAYINSHTNADEMKYSSVNRGDNGLNIETTVL